MAVVLRPGVGGLARRSSPAVKCGGDAAAQLGDGADRRWGDACAEVIGARGKGEESVEWLD